MVQVLGFEVEAINSVQFCCHTGYSAVQGQVLGARELIDLFDGLKKNDLHTDYSYVLTGYVSSLSFMQALYDMINELKSQNQNLVYVCDPVMGDDGKMYVPEELLPFFRDKLINLADVLTPNQFEAELLTGIPIVDEKSALQSLDALHDRGIPIVVLSSARLPPSSENITVIASKVGHDGCRERFKCQIEQMDAKFTGTGDLTAALLLAWLHRTNKDLPLALSNTMSAVQAVLKRTMDHSAAAPDGLTPRNLELKLVQSRAELESPQHLVTCVRI